MPTRAAVGRVVGHSSLTSEIKACIDICAAESMSIDSFPFVGAIPDRGGHFIAAGFSGHGTW